ncbi:MerR family transcriptional regulator [Phycicoccus avicenniae]|uniref:MerR family transcriptional regulator n=1 Tax=Phycicoccus avicenniae TaxID=2828860 RepID=UPI003D26A523
MTSPSTAPAAAPTDDASRTWTIAEVADEFGVTHRTVRHYEDLGLISPERRGTTRVYHRRDRTRLGLVLRGKRLGFPLEEIRTIIDLYDAPRGRRSQLEYVLAQIDERREDLEQRRRDLEAALSELTEFERRCRSDLDRLA